MIKYKLVDDHVITKAIDVNYLHVDKKLKTQKKNFKYCLDFFCLFVKNVN